MSIIKRSSIPTDFLPEYERLHRSELMRAWNETGLRLRWDTSHFKRRGNKVKIRTASITTLLSASFYYCDKANPYAVPLLLDVSMTLFKEYYRVAALILYDDPLSKATWGLIDQGFIGHDALDWGRFLKRIDNEIVRNYELGQWE